MQIVAEILFQIVFEFLIQGTGYLLCRAVDPKVKPDGALAGFVGIVFWVLIGIAAYIFFFRNL